MILTACAAASAAAQAPNPEVERHIAAARAAAGEHATMVDRLCPMPGVARPVQGNRTAPPGVPARESWHAEPAKVFDNFYFVGMTEFSAWAVTTSEGIIVIDPLFDYSVEDEVVEGLRKLGLDPADIEYVLVSHGHLDHVGGAKLLQERFGARVLLTAADWDLLERDNPPWKPRRDMEITDGMKLTLGDTTLTMYHTPGHTNGTVSTLIPLRDGASRHVGALWGGTLFNFGPDAARFRSYAESAAKFREHRGGGRRRRAALEPHRLRRHEAEAAGAGGAPRRRAASVRRRQRIGAPLPDGRERVRAGRARERAVKAASLASSHALVGYRTLIW